VDQIPLLGPLYLFIKVVALLFIMVWVRATYPRIRYDKLMAFGWKFLLPLALVNVAVTAVLVVLGVGA
jgi:NADH-quinone oxidoreductase subunit H